MKPGAMHRAHFMSHILYTMKMFIFRNSGFPLTNRELKGLKDIFVFAVLSSMLKSGFLFILEFQLQK